MKSSSLALKVNLYTIIAVYFLILVGGIVRSVGAGMGCPDWPKCFDSYIPPMNDSSLPVGYEDFYVQARQQKNERLSGVLSTLGFSRLADKVKNDPAIEEVTYFDATKAWVEYINRLVGVLIGFLIILNTYFSIRYWGLDRRITTMALLSLVLVLFQGWIGSLVVSTNLLPGFISFHMLLALLLVALLLFQRFLMQRPVLSVIQGKWVSLILLVLFTFQIVFGVEVREEIDLIKNTSLDRSDWIDSLGLLFYVHRSYSLVLVALVGYLYYLNRNANSFALKMLLVVVILEIAFGAIMAYFEVPAAVQPLHLLFAAIAFGSIFSLFLTSRTVQLKS